MTIDQQTLTALVAEYVDLQAKAKAMLAEADSKLEALLTYGWQPGIAVSVAGDIHSLVDNFAEGNAIWRPARVYRFSVRSDSKAASERKRKR